MKGIMLHAVCLVLTATLTCMLIALGIDYVTIYHGLHPMLAIPGALVASTAAAWNIVSIYELWLDYQQTTVIHDLRRQGIYRF
jgi:hypothetical protein